MSKTTAPSLKSEEACKSTCKIGDRTTSDVVVRLRTHEGRDNWFYCHSELLIEKSKYFADRLSEDWPTCQILDSRYCVEVYCEELDFNFHVIALRLLYVLDPCLWHGVKNALGILQVAVHLGCYQIARACVDYLEAVPWEEAEEEEILRTIPALGVQYEDILARLCPVDSTAVVGIFIATIRFATSSATLSMRELKCTAQEQLEYMLAEDDDAPLLTFHDPQIKSEVKQCVKDLLMRFQKLICYLWDAPKDSSFVSYRFRDLQFFLCDISWVCQILLKMEMMKDLACYWVEASDLILKTAEKDMNPFDMLKIKLKVLEVASNVLEAIGFGTVILPTSKRLHAVKLWLPFVQRTKPLVEAVSPDDEEGLSIKMDSETWQGLESAFVSIILTLPSRDQADILTEWLNAEHARYPDLTEAFEVWCYRSKTAKRRLASSGCMSNLTK